MERKVSENISFRSLKSEWDVYFDMAMVMLAEIMKNNATGKNTVVTMTGGTVIG